jgi:hypothetical protein
MSRFEATAEPAQSLRLIDVGDRIVERLHIVAAGVVATTFDNQSPARGLPSTPQAPTYMGMQAEPGRVRFRDIRVLALAPMAVKPPAAAQAKTAPTRK